MNPKSNNAFQGLPADLVNDILTESNRIAGEVYTPFQEIMNNRDNLRQKMREQNMIRSDSDGETSKILSSCAVDGCFGAEKFLSSGFVCAAAVAVEGISPQSGEKKWNTPVHRTLLAAETIIPEISNLANAVMMEMQVELAADAPHEIILMKGSYITPFVMVMEALVIALGKQNYTISKEFLKRLQPSIISFKTIFDAKNSGKIWAGVSKTSGKKELATTLNLPERYEDTFICTALLKPGEYTTPLPVEHSELSGVSKLTIKDEKFTAVRDMIVSAIGGLRTLYYRPHQWTPAFRIEIDPEAAENTSRLASLLNTIKYQCGSTGLTEPYPLHYAGRTVRNLKNALPSVRRLAASNMTNEHKEESTGIIPLLLFQEPDRE